MPKAALRPCSKSGCIELVTTGYCKEHQQLAKQRDQWRGSAASRGYDHDWQRVRVRALQRDHYLCQRCKSEGRVTIAEHVHHIQKITARPDLRLDLNNLMSVCRPCHDRYTANGE